jgi:unsaturated rhamnogalacturonyl hydrolase
VSQNDHATELKLQSPLRLAQAACDSIMEEYKPQQLPPAGRWHYHQGIFLHGMLQVWAKTGDERYLLYPKQYVDHLVDEYGNFLFARDELDAIMPGLLLFPLSDRFGEPRYEKAAAKLRRLFDTLNTTSEGAYWHKDKYPYQMWLDGLYMGGVFAMIYGSRHKEPELTGMVLKWEKLMRETMSDERTGLLYHAWDERRDFPWANPETGCSPEFWGRSLGWYGMAVSDFLDILPPGHEGRDELKEALGRFVQALIRFQDRESALWYQVVDKGDRPDNWLETSCTSLFVYTIAKAVKHGSVQPECLEAAKRGYEGLAKHVRTDEQGRLIIPDICIGTSAGDYAHYVNRPVSDNDLHGAGVFILACTEMDGLL